jgi:8-oxo-dGTP pyrophosphatase MutT (NUDIX family)
MAYYNKIGLLVLNKEQDLFLVCEKDPNNVTADYIMPGGQIGDEEAALGESEQDCLAREIEEELSCKIDRKSLKYITEYIDVAAGRPDRNVSIKLYQGKLIGEPRPTSEIKQLHWIGKKDLTNMRVSPIIRNKIIPDLMKKKILR